jgi:serine protease Do
MRFLSLPLLLWTSVGPARAAEPTIPPEVRALQETMHRIIDEAEPSIACISVSRSERYREFRALPSADQPGKLGGFDARPFYQGGFFEPARREIIKRLDLSDPDTTPDSYGSGVVIDTAGFVLTHFHVVRDATKVYVRLPGNKGSYCDIHAADGRSDLAVLRMLNPPLGLKAVRFGDGGKVRKGDWVVSVANPFSAGFRDGSPSASWGIISNVRRRAPGTPREVERDRVLHHYGNLIQTDARLNLGCSGSALVNLEGEMIALTTALAAASGGETAGGYAVPIDANVRRIVEVLRRGEEVEYGFLGVSMNRGDTGGPGVQLSVVTRGLPAARAKLGSGDTILSINGTAINNYDDLFLIIGSQLAGTEVTLKVRSPGMPVRDVSVALAKFNNQAPSIVSSHRTSVHGLRVEYTSVLLQNPDMPMPDGVLVKEVERGSPAEAKLKPQQEGARMIVTSVNGTPVTMPSEFYREARKGGGPMELRVVDLVRDPDSTARTVRLP